VQDLKVDPCQGLDRSTVGARRKRYGVNRIEQKKRQSVWAILLNQFKSVIVLLLSVAAIVTVLVDRWVEGITISVVVVFNALIGFFTELRAVWSMEALETLSQSMTKVRRGGRVRTIASRLLVPGDIVVFEAGDVVSADMRLLK